KLVVRFKAAERVAQEGSAIERRDANAELDVAHPGPAFEFGSFTRRENHPSKAKSRSCPRTCAAGKAPEWGKLACRASEIRSSHKDDEVKKCAARRVSRPRRDL